MNKSVKKCCICNNEQIGKFTIINNKKYHLFCIEQLEENYKAVLKQRDDTNKSAMETIEKYQQENELLKRQIDIKDRYCQLIIDLGYNYDGFNAAENLKSLIDQLVDYAYKAKESDDKSPVYENAEEKPLNILMEEVKE